ncbi:MAG: UDP-2,3-diacylglucosamine diphosphatase [Gemmatimonadota bacterium]|nr:UDP-2,3-diacylglucosamine diphosphatase [Gemmatimonadota bacterium]
MPSDAVAVVSDAHLGQAPPEVTDAFHRFLDAVPALAGHLVINGDLFDFWFEYRAVIPRRAFPVLSALDRLRRAGVRLTLTGGNHDRWGGDFWQRELGAAFHPDGTSLALAGRRAYVAHGDGLAERHRSARLMHRVTRWPATAALFRWLHPDLGVRLVDAMSGTLAESTRDETVLARAAAAQAAWARAYLADHPEVELLVLGHTHRPALEEVAPGRWYLNPGAFLERGRYALITADGPALRSFP